MSRTNLILLGVFAVQIVIGVVILVLPQGGDAEAQGGPLLAEFESGNVTELTITDNNGQTIRIAQVDGAWVLPEADNYPVRESAVTELLSKIEDLQANRLIAENTSSHRRLEVADEEFQRRIELTIDGDTRELYLGTASGANANHTRLAGDDRVYLTSGLASWEANVQPTQWVDPVYFQTTQENIVSLTIENENGTFTFENTDDTWSMLDLEEGETFDESTITTLLGQIANVRLQAPIGETVEESYGLDEPAATVTIRVLETLSGQDVSPSEGGATPEGEAEPETLEARYTIQIGSQLEDESGYYIKASNSPYIVTIASFTAENFTQKVKEDFLVVEEAPDINLIPTPGAGG